jgi:hypothetical protein
VIGVLMSIFVFLKTVSVFVVVVAADVTIEAAKSSNE